MLGETEGGRRRGQHRMRWLDGITGSVDLVGTTAISSDGRDLQHLCWVSCVPGSVLSSSSRSILTVVL